MGKLAEILHDSNYKLTLFDSALVNRLENRIQVSKDKKGKDIYTIWCPIRRKEVNLNPKEVVRQVCLLHLTQEYGYSLHSVFLDYTIYFDEEAKEADIVIMNDQDSDHPYIIVELKKNRHADGKEQLKWYCNAAGAPIGIWTNGGQVAYYHRRNDQVFEPIPDTPNSNQTLKAFLATPQTLEDLIKYDQLANRLTTLQEIFIEVKNFSQRIGKSHNEFLEEFLKLIFIKLYDEIESEYTPRRMIEFRLYNDNEQELKTKIEVLFKLACNRWEGIFPSNSEVDLNPSALTFLIGLLQNIKLHHTNLEAVVEAFEALMRQDRIRDLYFTPLYLIDFCIKMLNPKPDETIIDPATRSFLFPIRVSEYIGGVLSKDLDSEKDANAQLKSYFREKVFALNENRFSILLGKVLNLFVSDELGNFIPLNGLDYRNWAKTAVDSKSWIDTYFSSWKRLKNLQQNAKSQQHYAFDIIMSAPPFRIPVSGKLRNAYELGKKKTRVFSETLYIERAIDLLADGGRMALILPQGVFSNTTEKDVREFIAEKCRILAVVGLHPNVFKPEAFLKTSIIFLQKWTNESGVNPRKTDYSIFFATMQEPGKDSRGNYIYVKADDIPSQNEADKYMREPIVSYTRQANREHEWLLDSKNQFVIKHDLFNHENLFRDAIAEAFYEFAHKERLSFF